MALNAATWIQIAYPSEPNWSKVPDQVLVDLVLRHQEESSCAASALSELRLRLHVQTETLAELLITSVVADKWLQASALGILLSITPLKGLDLSLSIVDTCDSVALNEMLESVNYEHQGPLSPRVHSHPIIEGLRRRLTDSKELRKELVHQFLAYYGGA